MYVQNSTVTVEIYLNFTTYNHVQKLNIYRGSRILGFRAKQ